MKFKFTDGELAGPADPQVVENLSASLGVSLPADYLEFLRRHNGGDGFLGDRYFMLWRAEDLKAFNHEYEVEEYAPGILLFGSSGGGEAYGFDTSTPSMPIVRVPFVGMDRREAVLVAPTISALFAASEK